MLRPVRIVAVAVLLASSLLAVAPAAGADPTACPVTPGGPLTSVPWPQTRLDFQRAWPISTGAGVRVAVIDTGLDRSQPQMHEVRVDGGSNVLAGADVHDVRDCIGHGTAVAGIIAAPHVDGAGFVGVAPGVTVIPIKQTGADNRSGDTAGIAAGILAAIAAHADVVNVSLTVTTPTPQLEAAVADAQRAGLVIVAAAGNDGQGSNLPAYPAAYADRFDNVIAVSASDAADQIAPFADTGSYVTLAAPGVAVLAPAPASGYRKMDGTSFGAPYVTGTVALVLAAHPQLTPAQVRSRLEATADRPPVTVPDPRYGYGIVNPYLAVTSVRDDSAPAASPSPRAPLPAQAVPPPPDRHLAHLALGSSLALLAVALLTAVGAAVLRRSPAASQRNSA